MGAGNFYLDSENTAETIAIGDEDGVGPDDDDAAADCFTGFADDFGSSSYGYRNNDSAIDDFEINMKLNQILNMPRASSTTTLESSAAGTTVTTMDPWMVNDPWTSPASCTGIATIAPRQEFGSNAMGIAYAAPQHFKNEPSSSPFGIATTAPMYVSPFGLGTAEVAPMKPYIFDQQQQQQQQQQGGSNKLF